MEKICENPLQSDIVAYKSRIVDLFNLKKKDQDYIDKKDLITILKSLGFKICYEIFQDDKKSYSFDELNDYILKFQSNYYGKKKIENCIKFLNPSHEMINKNALKSLLCENGNKFTENEFKKFLVDVPVDMDGNIKHSDLVEKYKDF
ncbi:conserved Plasmodium protein, unknown function [Plasmodium malariae]|uniref:Uncharacterized protein n=1 Tax=Plasmodium malariae TaxID=5858 RepID=A0A1C3K9U6_PLAMA|nr:conserved Plasmodium protein, unknown function [Plasmodium malariae]